MSDELVNTLENLGLFFSAATGRLTRDYGELSSDNFQMMTTKHDDPKKLAKDLASLADAAALIRDLQQQLSTAREALEPFAKEAFRYDPPEGDDDFKAWSSEFTIGQLRRAAAVHSLRDKK